MSSRVYWAHSANRINQWDRLRDHLEGVATRAKEFAEAFDAGEQGRLAGLLHDLGKYADKFQQYLEAKVPRAGNHQLAGSLLALCCSQKWGIYPALAIQAHHGGLTWLPPTYDSLWNELCKQLRASDKVTESRVDCLFERFQADGLSLPNVSSGLVLRGEHLVAEMLDVRMLLSALVDADYLETEAHCEGDHEKPRRPRPNGPLLDCTAAIQALEEHLRALRDQRQGDPLLGLREELQNQCRQMAAQPQGIYTLSAPTGLGKTLAMLRFALYHAQKHDLRRIILVMPYINIVDQTAKTYREIFSPEKGFPEGFVLEHHSLADGSSGDTSDETPLRDLLVENWDAPIILTTNVQFFESLFANRPSRCRKLHRIARSVILFDEVQTLPIHLAVVSLAALSRLTEEGGPYRTTAVFATATQPAFSVLHERVKKYAPAGWQPVEIVHQTEKFFRATAHRVEVSWRHEEPVALETLAQELAAHPQVMCIVNLKRHAVELFRHLKTCLPEKERKWLFHLSTSLCPLHRGAILDRIKVWLPRGAPLRLVATQCVEAGVDLDFPMVYRALAPLEAIVQAAGRCNRNARRDSGTLIVFTPLDNKDPYPPGYGNASRATRYYLKQMRALDSSKLATLLSDPEALRKYFELLYLLRGYTDSREVVEEENDILRAIQTGNFEDVAKRYRLIAQQTIHVLVPYDPGLFESLRSQMSTNKAEMGRIRRWYRRAAPISVEMFPPRSDSPHWNHLQPIEFFSSKPSSSRETNWYSLLPSLKYDRRLGLIFPEDDMGFIV